MVRCRVLVLSLIVWVLATGVGQRGLDDAPVVGSMAALDQPVPLDAGDEARGGGRGQVEHLGDAAHRERAFAAEEEQQPKLPQGDVAGRRGWHLAGHRVEDGHELVRGAGQQLVIGRGGFRGTRRRRCPLPNRGAVLGCG